jgi:plastocyanin
LTTRRFWQAAAVITCFAGALACGDSESGGGGGSPTTPSGTGPGPSGATITIGANGAISPSQVTISTGQSVTFVNSHNVTHDMASDPHPVHTGCPSINALGNMAPGQTKLTNSFAGAGTCRFHDHSDENNAALKGTIVVQ